jgi:FkbM family methyltransferase
MNLIKYNRGNLRSHLRNIFVYTLSFFLGKKPKLHRIPFGANKGRKICTSFEMTPRVFLGIDEPHITKFAKDMIKEGDVVYDIGAHIGYTSLLFAQNLGDTGKVYAFEILPSTAELLKKTVNANKFNNIEVHNTGLGLSTQTIQLIKGPTAMTDIYTTPQENERTELCKITSLDQYVKDNTLTGPSLIKIDIEGAEIDCLRGGHELINKYKPIMLIEFHDLSLLKEGYHLLESWGYSLTSQDGTTINVKQLDTYKEDFHETVICLSN